MDTNAWIQILATGASTMFGMATDYFQSFYQKAILQHSKVVMDSQKVESNVKKKINNLGYISSSMTKTLCVFKTAIQDQLKLFLYNRENLLQCVLKTFTFPSHVRRILKHLQHHEIFPSFKQKHPF